MSMSMGMSMRMRMRMSVSMLMALTVPWESWDNVFLSFRGGEDLHHSPYALGSSLSEDESCPFH